MKQFVTFFLLICNFQVFSQKVKFPRKGDSTVVQVKSYYKGCGKIFSTGYTDLLTEFNANEFFSPTTADILLVETIMSDQYNSVMKSDGRARNFVETDYKAHYFKYYRQYIPMVNKNGEKIFYLQLFGVCKGKIKKYYAEWDHGLVSRIDEDPCTITIGFIVNLETQTALLY